MKMLPDGDGAVLIRTHFTNQPAWEELRAQLREYVTEGLLTGLQIVDDSAYQGLAVSRLLTLIPDDAGYAYIAVADRLTVRSRQRARDRTLLIVGAGGDERGVQFRTALSQLVSVDANLSTANLDLSDYADGAGDDGIFTGFDSPAVQAGSALQLDGRPKLTELLPGGTLRLGSISSASGQFVLVNQDDGDVVIYDIANGTPVWRTGTVLTGELAGLTNRLVLQDSGDLTVFEPTGIPAWSSGTAGQRVRRLLVTDDGRLVLADASGGELWSSERRLE